MVDTTLGYVAIYPEDVINHHRSFIARRRSLRPSEDREPTSQEWQDFLAHFELRKVALGVCARDFGTICVHEHACFFELPRNRILVAVLVMWTRTVSR
ncbi:hypothetical protein [Streptomyces sp. 1222.5]|uniref:hypothetical protein n=1 Tax=Streptomyces sp. 1222.5 TaxID=1881026 RepID=UPI003EBD87F2